MTQLAHINTRQEMSVDTLKKVVPSLFATKPSPKMSERYTFIPSSIVLTAMDKMGLVPVEASQRKAQDASTARHLVRFARKADLLKFSMKRMDSEVLPEVVYSGSHNGRAAFFLYGGLWRWLCANGLIMSAGSFTGMRRRHIGDIKGIMEQIEDVLGRTTEIMKTVQRMQRTKLSDKARLQFAVAALELRYFDPDANKVLAPITAPALLEARRDGDKGTDLWHTFNVVQENLMRGGVEGRSALGRAVRTREVKDVRKVLSYNTELWDLAAERIAA